MNAAAEFGQALGRLARAYERDPEKQRDLLQDIHLAIWTSFERFEGRCSVRTWVYRVAHNTATAHIVRQRREAQTFVMLEDIDTIPPDHGDNQSAPEDRLDMGRLLALIHRLKPDDRQIMTLYLEGMESPEIGEITGISSGHVRTQIHRIKNILARRFLKGAPA